MTSNPSAQWDEDVNIAYDVAIWYKNQEEALEADYKAGKLGRKDFYALRKELRVDWWKASDDNDPLLKRSPALQEAAERLWSK